MLYKSEERQAGRQGERGINRDDRKEICREINRQEREACQTREAREIKSRSEQGEDWKRAGSEDRQKKIEGREGERTLTERERN